MLRQSTGQIMSFARSLLYTDSKLRGFYEAIIDINIINDFILCGN